MKQIGRDLFRLDRGGFAAPHLVVGDVPTLIDAGGPGRAEAIEQELRGFGVAVRRIVVTHGDPDHVGGSDHLRHAFGAEVCAPLAERPLLDGTAWPSLPVVRRLLMRALFRNTTPPTVDRWIDGPAVLDGISIIP